MTTANYPDVMLPSYRQERVVFIYFALFLTGSYLLLSNMMVATFYLNYQSQINTNFKATILKNQTFQRFYFPYFSIKQYLNSFYSQLVKPKEFLFLNIKDANNEEIWKFQLNDDSKISNKLSNSREISSQLKKQIKLRISSRDSSFANKQIKEKRSLSDSLFKQPQKQITLKYNNDKQEDFDSSSKKQDRSKSKFSLNNSREDEEECEEIKKEKQSNKKLINFLNLKSVNFVLCFISFLVLVIFTFDHLGIKLDKQDNNSELRSICLYFQIGLTTLLIIDALIRLFLKRKGNPIGKFLVFEIITLILFEGSELVFLINKDYMPIICIQLSVICRIPRFLYALCYFKPFKEIFQVFLRLIPFGYFLALTLSILFYVFATIGMYLFGGLINDKLDLESQDLPQNYVLNNFNDMTSACVTLFELLIQNNWNITVEVYKYATGSNWVKIYFIVFIFLADFIGLNILVSFIIDLYVSAVQKNKDPGTCNLTKILTPSTLKQISECNEDQKFIQQDILAPLIEK